MRFRNVCRDKPIVHDDDDRKVYCARLLLWKEDRRRKSPKCDVQSANDVSIHTADNVDIELGLLSKLP